MRTFKHKPLSEYSKSSLASLKRSFGQRSLKIDILSKEGEDPSGLYIDQPESASAAPSPAPAAELSPAEPLAPARPTNLLQLLTDWDPGANRYGFQLKFRCRSTSGNVQDLQDQAPNLLWRERVTYSRNDFSHRINPSNPTILPTPPDGISFAPSETRQVGPNLLEFSGATDTHWMPTTAVRANDFQLAPPPPGFIGPVQPLLPAVMESRQVYQYSPDGGNSWRYLAGAFLIRRTLFQSEGTLKFRTQKTGVHTVIEDYKP